jgi:hypothetical protein
MTHGETMWRSTARRKTCGRGSLRDAGLAGRLAFLGKGVPTFKSETGEKPAHGSWKSTSTELEDRILLQASNAAAKVGAR